jgi:CHAT domain-containing protein
MKCPPLRWLALTLALAIAPTAGVPAEEASPLRTLTRALDAPDLEALARARLLLRRAELLSDLGLRDKALSDLEAAWPALERAGSVRDRARYWGILGEARRRGGDLDGAAGAFNTCRRLAEDIGDSYVLASAMNGLALVAGAGADDAKALALFARAGAVAAAGGHATLAATAHINEARLALDAGQDQDSDKRLRAAFDLLAQAPPSRAAAFALTALADLGRRRGGELAAPALRRALEMAEALSDARARSYALGILGRHTADAGQLARAETLTARALLAAAALDAPELDYLWRLQQGRLARQKGHADRAIEAYATAIDRLLQVRGAFLTGFTGGRSPFRSAVEPVFREFVDLLVTRAETVPGDRGEALIERARRAVESLKAVELQDYFGDDCLAGLEARRRSIDEISAQSAAIYPIILDERTVVIVSSPGGITWFSASVARPEITRTIRTYRHLLEKRTTREHLRPARQLYEWLIRPIADRLRAEGVETLVFTPDGPSRTIPFAALHDGERYLVERFAVAATTGLDLVDPKPLSSAPRQPLLLGLTQPRQGFSGLPAVARELQAVRARIGGRVLLDEAFGEAAFRQQIARTPYSIVHIASHGQFETTAGESFLLTHDGRLTLDELEDAIKFGRYREQPIELLTLSACSTAAGDDRAALGLAGVAIKAGARSALASLWNVNDESTSDLIDSFYGALSVAGTSKAEALRRAGDRALLGNGDEVAKLAEIHRRVLRRCPGALRPQGPK